MGKTACLPVAYSIVIKDELLKLSWYESVFSVISLKVNLYSRSISLYHDHKTYEQIQPPPLWCVKGKYDQAKNYDYSLNYLITTFNKLKTGWKFWDLTSFW